VNGLAIGSAGLDLAEKPVWDGEMLGMRGSISPGSK
jgi:hypothetical protein